MEFIKNHWKKIIVILVFPLIFPCILHIAYKYLPGQTIGTVDGWIGFLGAYFGVIGAIAIVWWQHIENKKQLEEQDSKQRQILSEQKLQFEKQLKQNEELTKKQIENDREIFEKQLKEEKIKEINSLLSYINFILGENINNYDISYITTFNIRALSFLYIPSKFKFIIPLKNFELTKEEKKLLFKYNFKKIVVLEEEIKKILSYYELSKEEEEVFQSFSSLKPSSLLEKQATILGKILIIISEYFIHYGHVSLKIKDIKKQEELINQDFIFSTIKKKEYLQCIRNFFDNLKGSDLSDITNLKNYYIHTSIMFQELLQCIDYNISSIFSSLFIKKTKLCSNEEFIKLIKNMDSIKNDIENSKWFQQEWD